MTTSPATRQSSGGGSRAGVRRPAGLDPNVGDLHVSPHGNLLTVLHEAIHKVAGETSPLAKELIGQYLNEGITEEITRSRLGPSGREHTGMTATSPWSRSCRTGSACRSSRTQSCTANTAASAEAVQGPAGWQRGGDAGIHATDPKCRPDQSRQPCPEDHARHAGRPGRAPTPSARQPNLPPSRAVAGSGGQPGDR